MKVASLRDFKDRVAQWTRETEPILVMRWGRLVGVYIPRVGEGVPVELRLKEETFSTLSAGIVRQLKKMGLGSKDLEDFLEWRRRRDCRRRSYHPIGTEPKNHR